MKQISHTWSSRNESPLYHGSYFNHRKKLVLIKYWQIGSNSRTSNSRVVTGVTGVTVVTVMVKCILSTYELVALCLEAYILFPMPRPPQSHPIK